MQEPTIRLTIFIPLFITLALLEHHFPRQVPKIDKNTHWFTNLGLATLNILALRSLFPLAATGIAAWAETHHIGILHHGHLSSLQTSIISLLILDLSIYWQHRLFHRIPLLWRIHKVHHTDPELDLTSGLRFHPLEILLSMLIKSLIILTIGIPVIAVLIFEILLSSSALFTHSNIKIPDTLEKYLLSLLVTPDMHRIHHSQHPQETNSNFSFNLNLWDRLFHSYCAVPHQPQQTLLLGLKHYTRSAQLKLGNLLLIPFQREHK